MDREVSPVCTCVLCGLLMKKTATLRFGVREMQSEKKNKKNKNSAEERQGERREEDMLLRREGIKEPSKWSQRIRR